MTSLMMAAGNINN